MDAVKLSTPLSFDWGQNPRQAACAQFRSLFKADEHIFAAWHPAMRARRGTTVRTRQAWEDFFRVCPHLPTVFLPNPVNSIPMPPKRGHAWSMRGSRSISAFRHVLVEFDRLSDAEQLLFWARLRVGELVSLVSTGTGSLEGLLRVDAPDEDAWKKHYSRTWLPLGCNPRCAVPTKLARLAGGNRFLVTRRAYRNLLAKSIPPPVQQRLLYLSPNQILPGDEV